MDGRLTGMLSGFHDGISTRKSASRQQTTLTICAFFGTNPADEQITTSFAQNRDNSGKRISTTLHGSHCLDRCLLRLALVNNRI